MKTFLSIRTTWYNGFWKVVSVFGSFWLWYHFSTLDHNTHKKNLVWRKFKTFKVKQIPHFSQISWLPETQGNAWEQTKLSEMAYIIGHGCAK